MVRECIYWRINFTEYEGGAYKYDIKSQYPSILKSVFMIPLKAGEFKKFSKDEFDKLEYFTYGIYRVKIDKSEDKILINYLDSTI